MIGLVDYDFVSSSTSNVLIPNLEIMKLANYYKLEKNTFCRLISLDETELSSYEKIYFYSETAVEPQIPPAFLHTSNVIYGGTTFTNGIYTPFNDILIDFTIARPHIYKEILKQKYQDGVKAKVISHVLDDSYYRMYAGNEQLPIPPIMNNKRIFIFDRDFFVQGWDEIMEDVIARRPSSIIPVHPIICHNITNYFKLRNFSKLSRTAPIFLDLNIPLTEVSYMLKQYKKLFLADIVDSSLILLPLGGSYATTFQYYKDFIYKINLLYAFWSAGIHIKIQYQNPLLGYKDPLEHLAKIVVFWSNGKTSLNQTLNERLQFNRPKELVALAKEEKRLLLKIYPTAKDLFDQNYTDLKEGGYWRL